MFNKREQAEASATTPDDRKPEAGREETRRPSTASSSAGKAVIGPSIHVDGKLQGDEDLVIEGKVKGTVELKNNSVTIGSNGEVKADIYAHTIYVDGKMDGNLVAAERIFVRQSAKVKGSMTSPRVSLEDGARFNGTIDMDAESEALAKAFGGKKSANGAAKSSGTVGSSEPKKTESNSAEKDTGKDSGKDSGKRTSQALGL